MLIINDLIIFFLKKTQTSRKTIAIFVNFNPKKLHLDKYFLKFVLEITTENH